MEWEFSDLPAYEVTDDLLATCVAALIREHDAESVGEVHLGWRSAYLTVRVDAVLYKVEITEQPQTAREGSADD